MKNIYKKQCLFIILIFVFSFVTKCDKFSTGPKDEKWKAADMGQVTTDANDRCRGQILFADLRQDGISRLYCLERSTIYSVIYEFSYNNNSWVKTRIYNDGLRIHSIGIGKCRTDGILRLYGVSSSTIYEFDYSNGQWTVRDIFSTDNICTPLLGQNLAIGDPQNNGFECLFILGRDELTKISYQNTTWKSTFIDTITDIEDIAIGNGRGDGNNQIYIINSNSDVLEYKFENGSWHKSVLGDLMAPTIMYAMVEVLNAHDGRPAVYVNTGGYLFELFYENGQWTKTFIGEEPGINQIHNGIGRNDGVHRIYSAENFDILAEFTLSGASWSKSSETKTHENTALTAVAVGPCRGDGINRVYVLQFIGHLFEFTFKD